MNFPDLETCRAIGAEFPDSEFVWAKDADGYFEICPDPQFRAMTPDDDIIAPAPTCEELGEWLRDRFASMGISGTEFGNIIMEAFWHYSETETQSRAEAVKLILEKEQ